MDTHELSHSLCSTDVFSSVSSTIKNITLRSMNITMTMMIIRTSHDHLYKNIFKTKNISPKYHSSTSKMPQKNGFTSSQYQYQQRLNGFGFPKHLWLFPGTREARQSKVGFGSGFQHPFSSCLQQEACGFNPYYRDPYQPLLVYYNPCITWFVIPFQYPKEIIPYCNPC